MNNNRRKDITDLRTKVTAFRLLMDDLRARLEIVTAEEQEYLEHMPLSIHNSPRGETAQQAVVALDEAKTDIETAVAKLVETVEALERAAA